jgi:hypothetical protein
LLESDHLGAYDPRRVVLEKPNTISRQPLKKQG